MENEKSFEFEEVVPLMEDEFESVDDITSIPSLLEELLKKEKIYRKSKLEYEQEFNRKQVTLNWDMINDERKEKGMPKLGSKEMREAFIKELLRDEELDMINAKLEYNACYRMYEMALKYSFEILR